MRKLTRQFALCLATTLFLVSSAATANINAQSVTLIAPPGVELPSITPTFTARLSGFGGARSFRYNLQSSTLPDFLGDIVLDTAFVSTDTAVSIQISRPLPSDANLFFRLRVTAENGPTFESALIGTLRVPTWLVLLRPNSPIGNQFDTRRPEFVWKSARVNSLAGPWMYDIEITTNGRPVGGTTGITDTVFRLDTDLETNVSYRWSIRASLRNGASVRVASLSTFGVQDPAVPTTTLLYQNFPNPFPTPMAFATCFWFDLAEPGGVVSLDILDLRGNVVRRLIPGVGGQREFLPGKYGRGQPGAGSNCDGRFVWDAHRRRWSNSCARRLYCAFHGGQRKAEFSKHAVSRSLTNN